MKNLIVGIIIGSFLGLIIYTLDIREIPVEPPIDNSVVSDDEGWATIHPMGGYWWPEHSNPCKYCDEGE